MPTSQNGWPVHSTSDGLEPLDWITGRVLPGDVHAVFNYLCRRFDEAVEPIRKEWSWGWNYRAIRGQSSGFSNHASATAIDLNAPSHPLGKRFTFKWRQRRRIRAILKELHGVVQWGGGWRRPDDMHFEIVGTAEQVRAVVRDVIAPLEVIAYNAKNGRGAAAGRDVAAIIAAERPHVLGLMEVSGNRAAILRATRAQYRLPVTGKGNDGGSTWLLVRKGVPLRRTSLVVSKRVWIGPKGRRRIGRTLPAGVIEYYGRSVAVVIPHMPWNKAKNPEAWNDVLRRLTTFANAHRGAFTAPGDYNHAESDRGPHTAAQFAADTNARIVGTGAHVDYAVVRGLKAEGIVLGRLKGGSDHAPIRIRHTFKENK